MNTKVAAVIEAVPSNGDQTALVLILQDKKTVALKHGDIVYVELTNALNGDRVQFTQMGAHTASPAVEENEEVKPQVEELDLPEIENPSAGIELEEEKAIEPAVDLPPPPEVNPDIVPEP